MQVAGETVRKPDRAVADGTPIAVDADRGYASRGALKLGPALERFGVEAVGRVCADIGASTGGFTDVLLRRGARSASTRSTSGAGCCTGGCARIREWS